MFLTQSAIKFVFAQFIVTSNVLTVTDENHERCIFPILPVNVLRSYIFIYQSSACSFSFVIL